MSKQNPEISVVMSVYNSEKYLAEAIESILNQTFTNFEFIIINDGSTDSSLGIIESYKAKDDRIELISRQNKGLPASLNEGIAIAKGKYIARMDADDISLPKRLEKQYEFMEANEVIGVCGSWAWVFSEKPSKNKLRRHPQEHDELSVKLLFSVCFIHPSVIMRKAVLDELDYVYNTDFINSQDYELWSRLVENTRFFNIQQPLIYYRDVLTGITAKVNDDGLNKRYPLVSQVQKEQLSKLDICFEHKLVMHFKLGLVAEMPGLEEDAACVHNYLNNLIEHNLTCLKFDPIIFANSIARKYFVYIIVSLKRGKSVDFASIISLLFIRGFCQFLKEKINCFVGLWKK